MPYIKPTYRVELDAAEAGMKAVTPGDLNFVLTTAILGYLEGSCDGSDQPSYADYNEVIGVLECAKLELYRRMVAPYEDKKKDDNGDVYSVETN